MDFNPDLTEQKQVGAWRETHSGIKPGCESYLARTTLAHVTLYSEEEKLDQTSMTVPDENEYQPMERSERRFARPEEVFARPQEVVARLRRVVTKPEEVVTKPEEVVERPQKVVEKPQEVVERRRKIVERPQKIVERPQKIVEKLQEVVAMPRKSLAGPKEAVEKPQENFAKPEEVFKASVNYEVEPHQSCSSATVGEPLSVQEPSPGINAQINSSGRCQYDSEPPPKRIDSLASIGPDLKTTDTPQRKHRAGGPSFVQEQLPGAPAQIRSSRKSQHDSEYSPSHSDSLSSKDPEFKTPDKPHGTLRGDDQSDEVLENFTHHAVPEKSEQDGEIPPPQKRPPSLDDTVRVDGEMNSQHETESSNGMGFANAQSVVKDVRKESKKGERRSAPRSYPPERQGDKIFQCRYCYRGFRSPYLWTRHEDGCGPPQRRFECMKTELSRTDDRGSPRCPFCGGPDSSDQHLNDDHNYHVCLKRSAEKRNFTRRDALTRHFKNFHRATEKAPASWYASEDNSDELGWCGFCEEYQGNRKQTTKHVRDHFQDTEQVFDMTRWKKEPKRPEFEHPESQRPESERPQPQLPELERLEAQNAELEHPELEGLEPQSPELRRLEDKPIVSVEPGSPDTSELNDQSHWLREGAVAFWNSGFGGQSIYTSYHA